MNMQPNDGQRLKAYPFPMMDRGTIVFDLELAGPVNLMVLDATGRLVKKQNVGYSGSTMNRMDLDVSNLTSGLYTILVRGEQKLVRGTIIVSH